MKRYLQLISMLMIIIFVAIMITSSQAATKNTTKTKAMSGCCTAMNASACNNTQMSGSTSSKTMTKTSMMASRNKSKASVRKPISAVCPVMGSKIPNISKAAGKSVYKGKTYYFCCPSCKPLFDKNPAKYTKK